MFCLILGLLCAVLGLVVYFIGLHYIRSAQKLRDTIIRLQEIVDE